MMADAIARASSSVARSNASEDDDDDDDLRPTTNGPLHRGFRRLLFAAVSVAVVLAAVVAGQAHDQHGYIEHWYEWKAYLLGRALAPTAHSSPTWSSSSAVGASGAGSKRHQQQQRGRRLVEWDSPRSALSNAIAAAYPTESNYFWSQVVPGSGKQ